MKSLVKTYAEGSLQDAATKQGISIQEAFMQCEIVVILDQSGSMDERDTRDGRSRFEVADDELAKIQAGYPGKVALVCFSDTPEFIFSGIPNRIGRGTDMAKALRFAKIADGACQIVIVSDGEPDSERETLDVARTYDYPINTIYIGRDRDGQRFLDELARATGGKRFVAPKPGELGAGVVALLTGGES
jgi:uncharacterized protein with von Willebrand factor type A (vWA) domain